MTQPDTGEIGPGDRPELAPENYKDLPPCIKVADVDSSCRLYHGSGVPLAGDPRGGRREFEDDCQACGGRDTRCIYFRDCADNVEHSWEYELECVSCGKFTQRFYWR